MRYIGEIVNISSISNHHNRDFNYGIILNLDTALNIDTLRFKNLDFKSDNKFLPIRSGPII